MHQLIDAVPHTAPRLPDIEQLYTRCADMSMIRAAYMLHYIFSSGDDEISVNGQCTTVMEFARHNSNKPAVSHLIWFWGGPPEGEDWYCGTLVTMLLDRYFYNMVDDDGSFEASMEFLGSLA